MDLIMATSRGAGIGELISSQNFNTPKEVITIRGATLETLVEEAQHIINAHPTPHKIHTYFIAGIPNITTRTRDLDDHYDEVIFNDTPSEAHETYKQILENAQQAIQATQSIPCFTTIAPMSLDTWNTTRLNQLKTHYLLHHNHYEDMQALLLETISNINSTIITLNDSVNMHTPKLGDAILHKQNAHTKNHRVRYGKLVDGLHINRETKLQWGVDILNSIMINRVNHLYHH